MLRSTPLPLTRRRFLAVSSSAGLLMATGCALQKPEGTPDPVVELLLAAQRDAREFAAADSSHGQYVHALKRISEVRGVHAQRLEELVRTPSATESDVPDPASEAPVVCPPVDEIRARLRSDADQARAVAVNSQGIRAELTGSVSAACVSAVEVLLP